MLITAKEVNLHFGKEVGLSSILFIDYAFAFPNSNISSLPTNTFHFETFLDQIYIVDWDRL